MRQELGQSDIGEESFGKNVKMGVGGGWLSKLDGEDHLGMSWRPLDLTNTISRSLIEVVKRRLRWLVHWRSLEGAHQLAATG
jgi:hypothetical protein